MAFSRLTSNDPVFINTQQGISDLADHANESNLLGDSHPLLYIDIEGEQLSRYGTISLLTVLVHGIDDARAIYVVDIHTLGNPAFCTPGRRGKTLKDTLESPDVLKVFFDVRNDSDALYAHYGIKLQGVRDLQLMENARRQTTVGRRLVWGLAKCIEGVIPPYKKDEWKRCKETGERLWNPAREGSYSAFNRRPLSEEIMAYCVGDVQYLPDLYAEYIGYGCFFDGIYDGWFDLIAEGSQRRVAASQAAGYRPDGPDRAVSPWTLEQNRMLDEWNATQPRSYRSTDDLDEYSWDDNDFEDWTRAPWQGPPS
ncbi:ribonuclease H-like domain-containing protein [Aspergillus recurvatus]